MYLQDQELLALRATIQQMKNRYNDTVFSPGGTLESGRIRSNDVLVSEDLRVERGHQRKLRNNARNDFTRY